MRLSLSAVPHLGSRSAKPPLKPTQPSVVVKTASKIDILLRRQFQEANPHRSALLLLVGGMLCLSDKDQGEAEDARLVFDMKMSNRRAGQYPKNDYALRDTLAFTSSGIGAGEASGAAARASFTRACNSPVV